MFWFSMTVVATVALLLAFLVNRNHQTALLEVPAIADRNEKEFHAALIQGYRKVSSSLKGFDKHMPEARHFT